MRVLVVTQHFAPEENAHSYRWTRLASEFADLGVHVDVLTAAWGDPTETETTQPRLTVHRVRNVMSGRGLAPRLVNEFFVALKSMIRARNLARPDVVIVTAPPVGAMLYARPLTWLLGRPLVLEMRDAWPELLDEWRTWSDYGNGPRPHVLRDALTGVAVAALKPLLYAVHGAADMIVTTTDSYAAQLRERTSAPVICIRNGPRDVGPIPRREFDGELHVLYMGNIGRAQMLATAVRAAAKVQQLGGRMRLRIVGDGAHAAAVKSLAEQLRAPVEFVGKSPHSEAVRHYGWADSVLVMLRDWEAMELTVPSKVYEVLRARRHISASVAGETARIVEYLDAGDVVPPQDPDALAAMWLQLLDQPALMRRERRIVDLKPEHDPAQASTRYVAALQDLVQGRTRVTPRAAKAHA